MTLYEIDKALMDFELEVDEETGEILNAADLDELKMAREDKIENLGLYIKNLKSESVLVKDKYLIPDNYMNLSVVREPNKKAIKDALKKGEEIMGVELVEKQNVQIR